jgi:hexokinase
MRDLNELTVEPKDIRRFIRDFHREMKNGLRGRRSSLKMLPTYAKRPKGSERGKFLALDLGGTNFRVGILELKGKRRLKPPLTEKFVLQKRHITTTGDALFDFLARSVKGFMKRHRIGGEGRRDIGFTFSFPIKKKDIAHGILVKWTKGFRAGKVRGKDIVGLLNESLARNGVTNARAVAIINDTVSTLVTQSYTDPCCDVGVILGTGTNACYYEGRMIVNIEWGNFNRLKRTRFDRKLDLLSRNPGEQVLEKMVSGMYLGKLLGIILRGLGYSVKAEDFKSEHLSEIEGDKTKALSRASALLGKLGITNSNYNERRLIKKICAIISTRAARLAASAIAAVVTKMDARLSRKHTIAIDGSLYEKHPGFSGRVKSTLREIFGRKAANIRLKLTKDASCKGAAIIAATVRRERI